MAEASWPQASLPTGHAQVRELEFVAASAEAARAALLDGLCSQIVADLTEALSERAHAVLAVSGGRSPIALFARLRSRRDLDWSRVRIVLVDERCVPLSDADSNAALVQAHLLQDAAASAQFVPYLTSPLPAAADVAAHALACVALAAAAQVMFEQLGGIDVAILGMGEDGHTASLFAPRAGKLGALSLPSGTATATAPTYLAYQPPQVPQLRLSLSLHGLLQCRRLHLPLHGAGKKAVYQQALAAPSFDCPVSMVLHQDRTPLTVWLSD